MAAMIAVSRSNQPCSNLTALRVDVLETQCAEQV
jgi:hypothetical protein